MPATPKNGFDHALDSAKRFLILYDLLHDTRMRGVRRDWAANFKQCMHWPQQEQIVRVDGKGRESILVLRESLGLTRDEFAHKYVSELLRASITASVSAMDRYVHDIVVSKSWILLSRAEGDVPKGLRQLRIPVLSAKYAIDRLRRDPNARPGALIKNKIQEILHKESTFQNVASMDSAAKMLGIRDFWSKISNSMEGACSAEQVQNELRRIVKRRNQIVHEADLIVQQRARDIHPREIYRPDAERAIDFINEFVSAFDILVGKEC